MHVRRGQLAVPDPPRPPDARAAHRPRHAQAARRRAPARAERGGLGRRDVECGADCRALGAPRPGEAGAAPGGGLGEGGPHARSRPAQPVACLSTQLQRRDQGWFQLTFRAREECPGAVFEAHHTSNDHLFVFCPFLLSQRTPLATSDDHRHV